MAPRFPLFEPDISQAPIVTETAKAAGFGALTGSILALSRGWWFYSPWKVISSEWTRHSLGFAGVFGTFYAVQCALAQARGQDDHWNTMAGGFAGGIVRGLQQKSLAKAGRNGVLLALFVGAADIMESELERMSKSTAETREKWFQNALQWPRKDQLTERLKEAQGDS